MENPKLTIGLVGNPNSGKTTIFNGLTGSHQHIGNWPGVTVEKKDGFFNIDKDTIVKVVDTPGIYSLLATSEDEKATLTFLLSREVDVVVNVVDATCIERSLYLTLLLRELDIPTVIAVSMMDIAHEREIQVDLNKISQRLGVPVIPVSGSKKSDIKKLEKLVSKLGDTKPLCQAKVVLPAAMEKVVAELVPTLTKTAEALNISAYTVATKLLENGPHIKAVAESYSEYDETVIEAAKKQIQKELGQPADVVLAEARYKTIDRICVNALIVPEEKPHFTEKLDKIVLNRFLGIPIFLGIMYVVFWLTQVVGGAFIDFFDIATGTIFVDGFGCLLKTLGAPEWLKVILADGVGAGLQTVATFIPPIFFMFMCLAILEDSGYMARAAFVMDRLLRWLGLPGKSFVPMLVGFGCTVPAIMSTRTLESKRDRFLTIFMTPFMSCGAKLPVWVVFGAAFFSENPGLMVFFVYLAGILLGIFTGFMTRSTLFKGEPSRFIMELPAYHIPYPRQIFIRTWDRLKIFITRAGKLIVPMILVLGVLNSIGKDGSFGNEDSSNSILSTVGRSITPVFEPMGVEKDNWPATVSIFTGLFAKEAVIGTMTSLYSQSSEFARELGEEVGAANIAEEPSSVGECFSFWGGIKEAFATIPTNLKDIFTGFTDPVGAGDISSDEAEVAETYESDKSVFPNLRKAFSKGKHQAFAYLLFILLYVPCIAATGAAWRELGSFYGTIFVGYLTVLGWCVATLYYQAVVAHQILWIVVPIVILVAMFTSFWIIGRKRRVGMI
ncbi:MAG: Fe(2+) transporter permease subunit FeoB [Kiritimatiellae bacterium]|nr:Fe(2+) transporter permease subunit FeoB [Kiritimatiellia bacterium]